MQLQRWKLVCGYARENFKCKIHLDDILSIIHQYNLLSVDTHILSTDEQIGFMDLLFRTFNKHNPKQSVTTINTNLLFRASEYNFDTKKFHQFCDNQGPTITIIHNSNNHVFGGYATESWDKSKPAITDPTAFLYSIRPTIQAFELRKNKRKGYSALANTTNDTGPAYGELSDLEITRYGHNNLHCAGNVWQNGTYEFDPHILVGRKAPDDNTSLVLMPSIIPSVCKC